MKLKSMLMKPYTFIKLIFVVFLLLIWNQKAFAMAGFSELDSTLHYNNFADISWGHPSDKCYGYSTYGQYCFYLIEKNTTTSPFHGAIQKISIPKHLNDPFILMESTEGGWIIYDLGLQGVIFESDDFELAVKKWKDFGLPQVTFANATNLSDYFEETEESKEKNKMHWSEVCLWLIGIIFYLHWKFWLGMSLIFLLALVVYIRERSSSTNGTSHRQAHKKRH